jgi:hypothetical protein
MEKNNLIRFVQSLALLPVITMSFSLSGLPNAGISQNVLVKKVNIETDGTLVLNQAIDPEVAKQKTEAEAIDTYFAEHDMPLTGLGRKMVQEAEVNNIDWRLLPAIAVRESTGGKFDCQKAKNNPFGWGSCKISFKSLDEAIETVALNLGGNNPNTAKHYDHKTVKQILHAYNPPSVVPRYAEQVIKIMNDIGEAEIIIPNISKSSSAPWAQTA